MYNNHLKQQQMNEGNVSIEQNNTTIFKHKRGYETFLEHFYTGQSLKCLVC